MEILENLLKKNELGNPLKQEEYEDISNRIANILAISSTFLAEEKKHLLVLLSSVTSPQYVLPKIMWDCFNILLPLMIYPQCKTLVEDILIKYIAPHANAAEILILIGESIVNYRQPSQALLIFKVIPIVILNIETQKARSKLLNSTIEMIIDSLCHDLGPDYDTSSSDEGVEDSPPFTVALIMECTELFLKSIVQDVAVRYRNEDNKIDSLYIRRQRNALIHCILELIAVPCVLIDGDAKLFKYCQPLIAKLYMLSAPLDTILVQANSSHRESSRWSKVGIAIAAYTVFIGGCHCRWFPQILSKKRRLKLSLLPIKYLWSNNLISTSERKGWDRPLKLLTFALRDVEFNSLELDEDGSEWIETGIEILKSFILACFTCHNETTRTDMWNTIIKFLDTMTPRWRYHAYMRLIRDCPYDNIISHLLDRTRKECCDVWGKDTTNIFASPKIMILLLTAFEHVMDFEANLIDATTSTIHLYRFLLMKEHQTAIQLGALHSRIDIKHQFLLKLQNYYYESKFDVNIIDSCKRIKIGILSHAMSCLTQTLEELIEFQ